MKRTHLVGIFAALCCVALQAAGNEPVETFSGDSSATTAEFEAEAPWIIDWRVTSEYKAGASIEASLIDAVTGSHVGYVLNTTGTGSGVKLFEQSGRFYLRVNSSLVNWTLKVEELSPEEAGRYTPREPAGG